jgi:hypothetical protein
LNFWLDERVLEAIEFLVRILKALEAIEFLVWKRLNF